MNSVQAQAVVASADGQWEGSQGDPVSRRPRFQEKQDKDMNDMRLYEFAAKNWGVSRFHQQRWWFLQPEWRDDWLYNII